MTTTGWVHSSRGPEARTTCRSHILRVGRKRQGPRNQGIWLPGQPPSTWGPPGGPGAPPGGPGPPTHPGVPVSTDEARWPLRTTICMAKEMRFLRLLLEWPGFPTLSYSVIQCTAAVPLHGKCFSQEYHFGKTKYFYYVHYYHRPPPQTNAK